MQFIARNDIAASSSSEKSVFLFESDKRQILHGGFVVLEVKYWGSVAAPDDLNFRKRSELLRLIDDACRCGELKQNRTSGSVTISPKQVNIRSSNAEEQPIERIMLSDLVAASYVKDDSNSIVVFMFKPKSSETQYRSAVVSVANKDAADRLCELVQYTFELAFGLRSNVNEEKKPYNMSTPASTIDRRSVNSERQRVPETPPSLNSSGLQKSVHVEVYRSCESLSRNQTTTQDNSNISKRKSSGKKVQAKPQKKGSSLLQNLMSPFAKNSSKTSSNAKSTNKSNKHKPANPDLPLTPAASNSNVSKAEADARTQQHPMPSQAHDSVLPAKHLGEQASPISVQIPGAGGVPPLASPSVSVANRTIRSTNSALSFATSEALQNYIRLLATKLNIIQLKRFSGLLSSFLNNRITFEDFCDSLYELYGKFCQHLFPGLRPFVPDEHVAYFEHFLMTKCGIVPNFVENSENYRTLTNGTISSESSTVTLTMGSNASRMHYDRSISEAYSNALQTAFSCSNDETTSTAVVQELDRILSELDDSILNKTNVDARTHLDANVGIKSTPQFTAHNYASVELQKNASDRQFIPLKQAGNNNNHSDKPNLPPSGKTGRIQVKSAVSNEYSTPPKLRTSMNGSNPSLLAHSSGPADSAAPNGLPSRPASGFSRNAAALSVSSSQLSSPSRSTSTSHSNEQSPIHSPGSLRKEVFVNNGAIALPPYRAFSSSTYYRQFTPGPQLTKAK